MTVGNSLTVVKSGGFEKFKQYLFIYLFLLLFVISLSFFCFEFRFSFFVPRSFKQNSRTTFLLPEFACNFSEGSNSLKKGVDQQTERPRCQPPQVLKLLINIKHEGEASLIQ